MYFLARHRDTIAQTLEPTMEQYSRSVSSHFKSRRPYCRDHYLLNCRFGDFESFYQHAHVCTQRLALSFPYLFLKVFIIFPLRIRIWENFEISYGFFWQLLLYPLEMKSCSHFRYLRLNNFFKKLRQDWVALMSKTIALFKKELISSVRLKLISALG